MKRLAALLEREISRWEKVTSRPMFGMLALYRKGNVFALLPRTRGLDDPNSVGFRLANPAKKILARMRAEERITAHRPGTKWISFRLDSETDLHDALEWFELAYRQAGK
jgi:hypothetical protein